jgi:hypothetical protein
VRDGAVREMYGTLREGGRFIICGLKTFFRSKDHAAHYCLTTNFINPNVLVLYSTRHTRVEELKLMIGSPSASFLSHNVKLHEKEGDRGFMEMLKRNKTKLKTKNEIDVLIKVNSFNEKVIMGQTRKKNIVNVLVRKQKVGQYFEIYYYTCRCMTRISLA